MKLLGRLIEVKLDEVLNISKGGIVLQPDDVKKPFTGVVVTVGDEAKKVKVSDRILFDDFSVKELEYDRIKVAIIDEKDIIAII